MFRLFKPARYSDPELGELSRSRGLWRGTIELASGRATLALMGSRISPDPAAVALARAVPRQLATWRSAIETALFEHYRQYAEAVAAGELPEASETLPSINEPTGVWPHSSLEFVSVAPLDGTLTTELGFKTVWDEEHTLGARFVRGSLIEMCGSVLPP